MHLFWKKSAESASIKYMRLDSVSMVKEGVPTDQVARRVSEYKKKMYLCVNASLAGLLTDFGAFLTRNNLLDRPGANQFFTKWILKPMDEIRKGRNFQWNHMIRDRMLGDLDRIQF